MFHTHIMAILISFLRSLKGFILTLKELQFKIIIFKDKPIKSYSYGSCQPIVLY